jgi:HlyD family secretion protein
VEVHTPDVYPPSKSKFPQVATMDRQIERKKTPLWKLGAGIAAGLALAYFGYTLFVGASVRTYRVPTEQLIVSTVTVGAFEDVIPIRGTIQPLNSVFLDAVNGGVVEEVFVEEGSFVEAGQPLLQQY